MSRLLLLLSTLLLSVVFMLSPETKPYDFFPLADTEVTLEFYIYYLCEHLILVVFAFFIYMESDKYKFSLLVFLLIQVADIVDFCLTYGSAWFEMLGHPITFNVIKILVFILAIEYEFLRYHTTGTVSN